MTDRVVGDDEPRRPRGPERSTSPDGADGPTIAARGWPRWRRGCGWTLVAGGLLAAVAALVMLLLTPEDAGANIGAGGLVLLSIALLAFGLLLVVVDAVYSRRGRR